MTRWLVAFGVTAVVLVANGFWDGAALVLRGTVLALVLPSMPGNGPEVAFSVSPSGVSVKGTY